MQTRYQADLLSGIYKIRLRFTENELGDTPAFFTQGSTFLQKILPGFIEGILVQHLVRVLQPAKKSGPCFPVHPLRQLTFRNFYIRQSAILSRGRCLYSTPQPQISEIPECYAKHIGILRWRCPQFQSGTGMDCCGLIRRIEITLQVTVIVIEHLRMVGNKIARAVFDRLNTTDNDILEIMDPVIFSRVIIDDTVNIALLVKLVA